MAYTNNNGQTRIGVRVLVAAPINASTLWNSIYAVYNADAIGSTSLNTSLYAAYNGESNANDSFGTNNGIAQGGLTYTAGKIGNAFTGNGTNGYISLPDNSWNITGTLSINLWVYLSSSSTNSVLVGNYYYSSGGRDYGFALEHQNNGNLRFYMQTSSNSPVILSTSYSGKYNAWKMITITKLQNSTLKMYIDGVSVSTNNSTPDIFYNSLNYSTIAAGRYLGVTYGYLENGGKIDGVNIWQKELTQSEITELYNSGNGAQYSSGSFYKPTTNDALNTYNGTAQGGLTYDVGKVGTAFKFNGTNAYVSLPDNSLNLTGNYSISFWVYFASNPSSETPYFITSFNPTTNTGFELRNRLGKPEFNMYTSGGLFTSWYTSNITINTSGWYHIVLTHPANQQPQFYINGSPTITGVRVSNSTVTEIVYTSPVKCSIGNNVNTSSNFMPNNSRIDGMNVWNRVLSAADITELYNSGNGKQYVPTTPSIVTNGLILNLDAGNASSYPGTGTLWTDLSGQNNNGTLVNGVGYSSADGGSLVFDKINDYGRIDNSSTINLTSTLTLSAWVKPNNINGWIGILYKNTPENQGGYHMGIDPFGYLAGGIKNPGWNTVQSTTNKLDLGVWQFVTMVLDLPNGTLKLFKNGVVIKTSTNFNFTITGNNDPLVIGANSLSLYELYGGNIGVVHLYNKVLTDAEVLQNYNATKTRFGL